MNVDRAKAAASFEYQGNTYYFCHIKCREKFAASPDRYLERKSAPLSGAQPGMHFFSEDFFVYSCPMHPQVRQNKAGSCSICGMALESALAGDDTQSSELEDLKKAFYPAALFAALLFLISMPMMLGLELSFFPFTLSHEELAYLQLFLCLLVLGTGGRWLLPRTLDSFLSRQLNMFSLLGLGVSISFLVSLWALFLASPKRMDMLYFESAAGIIALALFGQILELKARKGSQQHLRDLFALVPLIARRENESGEIVEMSLATVTNQMKLRVLAGDLVPVDGLVISGNGSADESVISGNSIPVSKVPGDKVFAATQLKEGSILIHAESLGKDTVFAQMAALILSAKESRSPVQKLADSISAVFIPFVFIASLATFLLWLALAGVGALRHAVQDAISVLVIACPCALGLATPLAVSLAVSQASKQGLLVKDTAAFESMSRAKRFLVDKTGTLSKGSFSLKNLICKRGLKMEEAIKLASALETHSLHPLAQAIVDLAASKEIAAPVASNIESFSGLGLCGTLEGKKIRVGSKRFMSESHVDMSMLEETDESSSFLLSGSTVYLAAEKELIAVFVFVDELKESAADFLKELERLNLKTEILSGDNNLEKSRIAGELNLAESNLHFEMLPQDKVKRIRDLQAEGELVCMLGDGVNDAAALAAANAGIALSSGANLALSSASMTVMSDDLLLVSKGIRLSRRMVSVMKENLFLAFVYNAAAILVASGLFYHDFGLELNPALAALAMSFSSLSVILNSLKLKTL